MMGYNKGYQVPWPTMKEQSDLMLKRKRQNLKRCRLSKAEEWMFDKLKKTGLKWSRQACWGFRLFDFWCAKKGIAVEVDGPEHKYRKDKDERYDRHNYDISGILVIRVSNFDEEMAEKCIEIIGKEIDWKTRIEIV